MGSTERFQIQRELASSPPRAVYQAKDAKTGRLVLLHAVHLDTPEASACEARLRQQAKAASVLNSPNIPSIYGGGNQDGMFFVVLEYVQGANLRDTLARRQRMLMSEFMDLARQVCTGLDHAHHHGLFHTNLHPGNIVVELDGTAKILDFGIPKDIPPDDDRLRYAAPEQLRGNPPDARVNLFSWGAILYELLTRRPAFAGCDREALPPAPHAVDAAIPEGVSRALMKALALDPAERYASGQELVAALEDRVAQRPLPVPVPCTEPPLAKP